MRLYLKYLCQTYIQNEKAATAIEYGLIAAGIAIAISAMIFAFGDTMEGHFEDSANLVAGRNSN